jgi:hypothetical protein
MKVFISWSGERSKLVANALREWIPDILPPVQPWMSASDIGAGVRWNREIDRELEETLFGIVCLTKENQTAPWVMFEAGALAKTVEETYVCPYLIGLDKAHVLNGPLSQFQAKRADEKGTLELLSTMNLALKEEALPEARLNRTFRRAWPDLEKILDALPEQPDIGKPERTTQDMVVEVLELVRGLSRQAASDEAVVGSYRSGSPGRTEFSSGNTDDLLANTRYAARLTALGLAGQFILDALLESNTMMQFIDKLLEAIPAHLGEFHIQVLQREIRLVTDTERDELNDLRGRMGLRRWRQPILSREVRDTSGKRTGWSLENQYWIPASERKTQANKEPDEN